MVKVLPAPTTWASSVLPAAHAPPDGVLLVRMQLDRLVHAGEVEVRAVEKPGPKIVVGVVVEPNETFRAVGVGEDPGAETLLDDASVSRGRPACLPG